ncbi:hypothetical protein TRAPUB_10350 [Trametes pubescens]|uniref:F-box domain-containing protein n=1 Tax=Trametes pubescens TaxID=154538 RepID=A0A1M2VZX5_TRAPU|nr:hypothetical protein TRAPUB_10350 [Trametes pubescens]
MATDNPLQIDSFCTLPQDIHFKILCELDLESLLRCKQVKLHMYQYLELGIEPDDVHSQGMPHDGRPHPGSCSAVQDQALAGRYGRRNWFPHGPSSRSAHPEFGRIHAAKAESFGKLCPSNAAPPPVRKLSVTGGILPYIQDGHFVLWQPGSALRGVEEITIVLSSTVLKANTIKPHLISGCVVDASQDLLAVTTE